MTRVLALAAASGGCDGAMVADGAVAASFRLRQERGLPEAIPPAVAALIEAAGPPGLVAVVVGPGSFTGLRASIAVAQGVGLGADAPVLGVTVAEALAAALGDLDGRVLWVANAARRGFVFLDRGGDVGSWPEDALPSPSGRIAVAGDSANEVACALAARGADVMLTGARRPEPLHVARVALRRAQGGIAPLAAVPLYVDPARASMPAGGLRPAPVRGD